MKRFFCLAVAIGAIAAFGVIDAQAQEIAPWGSYGGGFYNYGYNFNGPSLQREQPPYFALYPPVYYSNQIVRRPMGVSPFAAPPGVVPVGMNQGFAPQVIRNPYFQHEAKPVTSGKLNTDT